MKTRIIHKLIKPIKTRLRSRMAGRSSVYVPADKLSRLRLNINAIRLRRTRSELPVDRGRIVVNKLDARHHYYVLALTRALRYSDEQQRRDTIAGILRSYTEKVTITDSAQRLGLNRREVPQLDQTPPWVILYPWNDLTVDEAVRNKNTETLKENRRDGLNLDANQGGASYPLSHDDKLASETDKLCRLLSSIQQYGFRDDQNSVGGIGAKLLVDEDGEWVWHISGGFHRCCVLAALNYPTIPATVGNIIYRKDVRKWPVVRNGLFSADTALKLFDNIFYGSGFPAHNAWMEKRA